MVFTGSVTNPEIHGSSRPGVETDHEPDPARARRWCRRGLVVAALSTPLVLALGGTARADSLTDPLDDASVSVDQTTASVDATVSVDQTTASVDATVSVDQTTAGVDATVETTGGPSTLDDAMSSVQGTTEAIQQTVDTEVADAEGTVDVLKGAADDLGSTLEGTVSSSDLPGSVAPVTEPESPIQRSAPSSDRRATAPSDRATDRKRLRSDPATSRSDPIALPRAASQYHGTPAFTPIVPSLPISQPIPDPSLPAGPGQGIAYSLILLGLLGSGLAALVPPGSHPNRPPPRSTISFLLVLSLEQPG
jgi:hypothetical protein